MPQGGFLTSTAPSEGPFLIPRPLAVVLLFKSAAVLSPMPQTLPTGSSFQEQVNITAGMAVRPEGFCHFDPIFASTLLGARPTENVKPSSVSSSCLIFCANFPHRTCEWAAQAGKICKTLVDAVFLHLGRVAPDNGKEALRKQAVGFVIRGEE